MKRLQRLERLAALTPRPRINLVLYYGVLGAHAAWRTRLGFPETAEPSQAKAAEPDVQGGEPATASMSSTRPRPNFLLAQLM